MAESLLQMWRVVDGVERRRNTVVDTFVLGTTRPDATNTGAQSGPSARTSLTTVYGDLNITTDNAVVEGKDVHGFVNINANNVTLRNCYIRGRGTTYIQPGLVQIGSGQTGSIIEHCTIKPDTGTTQYWWEGVQMVSGSHTINRCDISNTDDCLHINGGTLTATGNYLHDVAFFSNNPNHSGDANHPYWSHNDGIQFSGGTGHHVEGNNFQIFDSLTNGTTYDPGDGLHDIASGWNNWGNAITISPDGGAAATGITGLMITKNWFAGGDACFQANYIGTGQTAPAALGEISYNRFSLSQHDAGSSSFYQIRYATGYANPTKVTTNYWDPDTAPNGGRSGTFTIGFTGGIRTP